MTDRNGIIQQIEELLGAEGSRPLAEAMLPLLEREHYVSCGLRGYVMAPVSEHMWLALLAIAEKEND